jgi:two-component system, NarL family, invasion response regulator UvrY
LAAVSTLSGHQQTSRSVGVVVVDDQAVFRRAAREVIDATAGFEVLGEASSGEEALRVVDRVDPDLVLIDVRMPAMNGTETARRLSATHPKATIVLISTENPTDLSAGAESFGAVALISKEDFGVSTLRRLWTRYGSRLSEDTAPR